MSEATRTIGKTAPMNPRTLLVAPLFILGLAACGDDESSGSSKEDFCAEAEALDNGAFEDFASAETPEEVEAGVTAATEELRDLVDSAPAEIKDQVELLADVYDDLAEGLEDNDWDIEAYFASPEAAE